VAILRQSGVQVAIGKTVNQLGSNVRGRGESGDEAMSDQAQQFYVAETADGKFVAYTTRAPYFCFVEDSEEAAVATGHRAFDLVERIAPEDFHEKSVSRTVTELRPLRVVSRERELAI
jgi:hypothetical protein